MLNAIGILLKKVFDDQMHLVILEAIADVHGVTFKILLGNVIAIEFLG